MDELEMAPGAFLGMTQYCMLLPIYHGHLGTLPFPFFLPNHHHHANSSACICHFAILSRLVRCFQNLLVPSPILCSPSVGIVKCHCLLDSLAYLVSTWPAAAPAFIYHTPSAQNVTTWNGFFRPFLALLFPTACLSFSALDWLLFFAIFGRFCFSFIFLH